MVILYSHIMEKIDKKATETKLWLILTGFFLILLILSRLLVEIPNFTPTISLVIFASLFIRNNYAMMVIIVCSQLISDYFLGFYQSMFFVYISYILISICSLYFLKKINYLPILLTSISAPVLFYIVTNFGVWFTMDLYAPSLHGLIDSYVAGIPFLKSSVLSTIIYSSTIYVICKYFVLIDFKKFQTIKK